jgi:formamidopyrimidine-DNA glycosylase
VPELPEVETVRLGLAQYLTGSTIRAVEILDQRSLKRHLAGPQDFVKTLADARVLGVVRRGKFLWLPLRFAGSDGVTHALVGHLGMSGQMLIRDHGAEPDKLTRVILYVESAMGDQLEFRFVDQRIFGSLQIDNLVETSDGHPGGFSAGVGAGEVWQNLIPASAAHIARDPLDEHFDQAAVASRIVAKHSGIKRVLLDQGVLSGIGNIYADEALWQAKLHFDTPGSALTRRKVSELIEVSKTILERAVAAGGTSFDEQYKNVNGESGYFEVSLNAYGQTGKPCNRCGSEIRRENWMNRGSHFCPKCQKLKH